MNRYPATQMQISPLQLRQGLFFSLALLLTLIAGQLYHNWQSAQNDREVSVRVAHMFKVPAATPTTLMQLRPAAVNTAPTEDTPVRDRWVF